MKILDYLLASFTCLAMASCAHHGIQKQPEGKPDPTAVAVTGSNIKQPIEENNKRAKTSQPVKIYTREEIQQTGQIDTAKALERLCPALRVSRPASRNLR